MTFTSNPALNQKLMQLDQEYAQQKNNLMQSFYNQQQNNWNHANAQQPPQTNQGLFWVQGEAGAKSYLVAPNTTVLLMDSEGSRFYLKSADNAGMPSLRIFEYSEVSQNAPQAQQSEQTNLDDKYVTREEYNALQGKYAEILNRLDNFSVSNADNDAARRAEKAGNSSRNRGGNNNV